MNNLTLLMAGLSLLIVSGCAVKGDYTCGVPNNGVRCQPMNETHAQLYDGSLNSLHVEPFPEDEDELDYDSENTDESYTGEAYSGDNTGYDSSETSTKTNTPVQAPRVLTSIKTIQSKQAILSPPREMRVWFDRFTDPDGDLHDESFMFIRLDNGHWMIDNKPVLY